MDDVSGWCLDIQNGIKVFLVFVFLIYLEGRVMKAFTVITIIALVLLVGGGVTAGLIAASEQAPSQPPPQVAIPLAELPQVDAPAETVRSMQSSVVVQQSGADTPDSLQGRGLTAKPAASGDVDDQFSIPEKTELKYPNLGSSLDQMAAKVDDGEVSARDAAKDAPVSQEESVAVTIYLSGNVDEVVAFLEDNGGDPRNIGEDYIEAYVPVTLLGPVSEQPGVTRVREIVPPQPIQTVRRIVGHGPPVHGSAVWNQAGYSGQGVKVGIIDVGFKDLSSLMGTELPARVQGRCYTDVGVFTALLNEWEVVLSWRHEAKTASLQSSSQEKRQHQEIPVSDT